MNAETSTNLGAQSEAEMSLNQMKKMRGTRGKIASCDITRKCDLRHMPRAPGRTGGARPSSARTTAMVLQLYYLTLHL
jgi:hypothetical protein